MSFLENRGNGNENWLSVRGTAIRIPQYFPCPKQGSAPGRDGNRGRFFIKGFRSRDEYLNFLFRNSDLKIALGFLIIFLWVFFNFRIF